MRYLVPLFLKRECDARRRTNNISLVANLTQSIYRSMTNVDPQARWMFSGWTFFGIETVDQGWWTWPQMRTFLGAVPSGKLMIQVRKTPSWLRGCANCSPL